MIGCNKMQSAGIEMKKAIITMSHNNEYNNTHVICICKLNNFMCFNAV